MDSHCKWDDDFDADDDVDADDDSADAASLVDEYPDAEVEVDSMYLVSLKIV